MSISILLTRQLATQRQQARRVYPAATWLPGDEPPVGAVVCDGDRVIGVVEGEYDPGTDGSESLRWHWLVRKPDGDIILEWPPRLRPATEGAP
jgi:hypothetical protein